MSLPNTCEKCLRVFMTARELETHACTYISPRKMLKCCNYCEIDLPMNEMIKHVEDNHKDKADQLEKRNDDTHIEKEIDGKDTQ